MIFGMMVAFPIPTSRQISAHDIYERGWNRLTQEGPDVDRRDECDRIPSENLLRIELDCAEMADLLVESSEHPGIGDAYGMAPGGDIAVVEVVIPSVDEE